MAYTMKNIVMRMRISESGLVKKIPIPFSVIIIDWKNEFSTVEVRINATTIGVTGKPPFFMKKAIVPMTRAVMMSK